MKYKYIFLILSLLLISNTSDAQITTWHLPAGKVLTGMWSSGSVTTVYKPEKIRFSNVALYPYVGVKIHKNVLLGLYGQYGWVRHTKVDSLNFDFKGIGYFARYYLFPHQLPTNETDKKDWWVEKMKLSNKLCRFLYKNVTIYTEFFHIYSNLRNFDSKTLYVAKPLQTQMYSLGLGFDIRIWKNLAASYVFRETYFPYRYERKYPIAASLTLCYYW